MRKLTLLLSLLLSVGLAAQEGPNPISDLNSFTDGWYQIKTQKGLDTTVNGIVYPAQNNKYASCVASGTYIFSLVEEVENLSTYIYIYKQEGVYHIKSATGRYAAQDATIATTAANLTITNPDEDKTQIKILGGGSYKWGGWGQEGQTPIIGCTSDENNRFDCNSWRFQIYYADTSTNRPYTVNITGAPDGTTPTVTYTKDGYTGVSTVYDGGTFFAESISEGEITADGVTDPLYIYSVNIDEENSTITVNFDISYMEAVNRLEAEINKFGNKVGYPTDEEGTGVENVKTLLQTAKTSPTRQHYEALQSALDALWAGIDINNIVAPEDGKVYKIAGITPNGTIRNLYVNGEGIAHTTNPVEDESGYFICQTFSDGGVKLAPATAGGYFSKERTVTEDGVQFFFRKKKAGAMGHTMLITPVDPSNTEGYYVTIGTTPSAVGIYTGKDGNPIPAYYGEEWGENHSTDFVFEEVEVSESGYAGFSATVALGSSNDNNYGTLCLPFASIVPDGVTVNGVEASGDNELTVMPLDLTNGDGGKILPAGTPVLLSAGKEGVYTFAPAAAFGTSAIETGLQGTFAAKAVREETAYILAYTDAEGSEIKFFKLSADAPTVNANKAYYVPQTGTNAQALSLHFGTTTGLAEAAQTPDAPTAVYDLSGRQVGKATRGLYIVGGRKVLVK